MDIRFDEKVVVIIGGSSGIGAATVKLFLQSGAKVVFTGVESELDIDTLQINKNYENAKYYQLDITDENAVVQFADFVGANYTVCDVLYNNAGILVPHILHETPTAEWNKVMSVNVNGVFLVSKYIIPLMIKNGGGAIINTSSMSGLQADYTFCSYNTSKGAVANLTRNMALDYAEYNIRVNAVAPGSVRTNMYNMFAAPLGGADILDLGTSMVYPMNRPGLPEEIANAVLFLASEKASFINGINLVIDGGLTAHTGSQHDWEMVAVMNEHNIITSK